MQSSRIWKRKQRNFVRWPFLLRRVSGPSMEPTLTPGQLVIICGFMKPRHGCIVQFRHDNLEKIKRVQRVHKNSLFVVGDNLEQSTDSRAWGTISLKNVQGVLIWPRVR